MSTKHLITVACCTFFSISAAAASHFKLVCRDPQMNFLAFVEEGPDGKPAMSYGVQELGQVHLDKVGGGYSIEGSYHSDLASGTMKLTVSAEQASKPVPFELQVSHRQSSGCQPPETTMISMLCIGGPVDGNQF